MSSSREVTEKKKKDVWEEAGGEFYTESYPSGSKPAETTHRRRPSRLAIPLPSHTARRGSLLQGRNNKSGRKKPTLLNNTGARSGLTFQSTMGGGGDANGTTTNVNDIQVAILPDLSDETILNERRTWEELMRIKAMPVPMAQKKQLKAQLANLPKLRLKGWSHLKFVCRKFWGSLTLQMSKRRVIFFNKSIRKVELRCGTAIANVFLFLKWTLFLNLAISLALIGFIIGPYITHDMVKGGKPTVKADALTCSATAESYGAKVYEDRNLMNNLLECCRAKYEKKVQPQTTTLKGKVKTYLHELGAGNIDMWPIHFSFYHDPYIFTDFKPYPFHAAYVFTGCVILVSCLLLLIQNIGKGVREIIKLREGEFYKYSNLVFSGWDHFTSDEFGENFKRRIIRNEIKRALRTEKKKMDAGKTKKQKFKLLLLRIFVNIMVLALLAFATIVIFYMTLRLINRARDEELKNAVMINENMTAKQAAVADDYEDITPLRQVTNQTTNSTSGMNALKDICELGEEFSVALMISFFNLIFPIILTRLGKWEDYKREWETALILLRALFIRIFSVLALAAGYYKQTYCFPKDGTCVECNWSGYNTTEPEINLNDEDQNLKPLKNRVLCWEGEFAAQVYKLIIIELGIKIILTFILDPIRRLVKYLFKNKLGQIIGSLSFNIIRHSLDIIYIQILSWISFYFAPFSPIVVFFYLYILFYVKKVGVLCNVNYVPDTFRTTRTTAVYIVAKIISFLVVTLTFVFVVLYMTPSRECGPFRGLKTPWEAVDGEFKNWKWLSAILSAMFPGVAVPIILVMILMSYYYFSVAQANRQMVETLRHLLILEGHDKQYLFAKLNSLRRKSQSNSPTTEDGTLNQP